MSKYNPFDPNGTVKSNLFAGRALQVDQICSRLSQLKYGQPASFFLYGERGIGKTALAKLIKYISTVNDKRFHDLNLLTSYYSVEEGQSLASVLQESLNKLTENMDTGLLDKLSQRLGKLMEDGKFQIGAFGSSISWEANTSPTAEKEKEIIVKDQAVSILSNIIKNLNNNPSNVQQGVLIIIDEFHSLKSIQQSASILRNIITSLDFEDLGKVAFMLIGYEEDLEKFIQKDPSSKRIFDFYKLDVMPDDEASQILIKGFKNAQIKWDESSLLKHIKVAGGYPHSIQLIGHTVVNFDFDSYIDDRDWNVSTFEVADILSGKGFSEMYSYKKPILERDKILITLAQNNRPMGKVELTKVLSCKNIYQQVKILKDCGAIKEDSDGKVNLQSQLLRVSILIDLAIRREQRKSETAISNSSSEP